jgi:hypothetical protein
MPAKAGIHGATARAADKWVSAFAGTTTWVKSERRRPRHHGAVQDAAVAGHLVIGDGPVQQAAVIPEDEIAVLSWTPKTRQLVKVEPCP